MRYKYLILSFAVLPWIAAAVQAQTGSLAFSPPEGGYSAFDTGPFKGRMKLDGKYQGIASIVDAASGMELAKPPGLLSYYRVFSTDTRYGNAARDWPLSVKVHEDGALEIRFPPGEDHPLEITGTFRWVAPDTLDLQTVVKPQVAMPRMEVFLSTYVVAGFDALIYVKPNRFATETSPEFLRADWCELFDGNYLVFPRDRQSLLMVYDQRWEIPPSPVTWAFARYLAAPVALRRHAESGITVAWMAPPEDCFAVLTPYNKQPPDNVAGHSSLYLSLFGKDVAAGETARAHCRMVIAKGMDDEQVLQRFAKYREERKAQPASNPAAARGAGN
ncbi:MAG: hypothetical protein GXY83_14015 [Rhodopirellula sp.]|nr:hypothetical protein [Rhodopirellula sp.]